MDVVRKVCPVIPPRSKIQVSLEKTGIDDLLPELADAAPGQSPDLVAAVWNLVFVSLRFRSNNWLDPIGHGKED